MSDANDNSASAAEPSESRFASADAMDAVPEDEAVSASGEQTDQSTVVRPVSETVGTGSVFGIGCSIVALLFVCVGIAIFMWRQTN